jgi:outer membrane protein OmpA-like peptidoglycan-associated protein
MFTFYGVKFLKEYIIKLDTSGSLSNSTKAYISNGTGAVFASIEKSNGKFEYTFNQNDVTKLSANEKEIAASKNAVMLNANFTFKTGTSEFDSNAEPELNKIAIMMTKNKEYTLEIIAHTDCKGDDAANLELSKKRAAAIKSYLVAQGITALRMRTVGKGESEILNKCKNGVPCSDAEHLENSRVELKFHKP